MVDRTANQSTSLVGGTNSTGKRAVLPPDYQQYNTNSRFHAAHYMAADNVSAKKVVSIRALSRMSIFFAGNI